MILFEGESMIDGAPIVAIGTTGSKNRKTGDMGQVWILSQDMHPSEAQQTGRDISICGDCPIKAGCYVVTATAPAQVWRKYKAGGYRRTLPQDWIPGGKVRLGAYGDPAALPAATVRAMVSRATGWTGYTHQWESAHISARENARAMRDIVMASVEDLAGAARAQALGFRTFRVSPKADPIDGEIVCPHEKNAAVTCAACGKCNGAGARKRPAGIVVSAHGVRSKNLMGVIS